MKTIGTITILFSILAALYLIEDYRNKRIPKKTLIILLSAYIITILGSTYLTIANW